jgi:hypothetical protein
VESFQAVDSAVPRVCTAETTVCNAVLIVVSRFATAVDIQLVLMVTFAFELAEEELLAAKAGTAILKATSASDVCNVNVFM